MFIRSLPAATLALTMTAAVAAAQSHQHGAGPGDAASTRDFKEADRAMMKAMDRPYTGDADRDFRTHMIPHHQGAIDMAKVALRHATDPATKALAQRIIDDQEREIGEMRDWLKARGR